MAKYIVKPSDVLASCQILADQKLSGLRPVITPLTTFKSEAEYLAVIEAIEGRNDAINVRRVLNKRKGDTVCVQVLSFHGDDRFRMDGDERVADNFFEYADKNGEKQKACRRKFWYESVDGTQGFGTFPMPFELGDSLKQGDQITVNLHFISAGTPVIQVAKDGSMSEAKYPVDTYYEGIGGGFNAFKTSIETLTAVHSAYRGQMKAVKSPKAVTTK